MALEIRQTYAKIGIDRTPGTLTMESSSARLELHQKQAKINIKTDLPKIEIDQYECFASSGLKNNGDMIKAAAQKGYQQVMSFIEKTASDGQRLAAIQNGGNAIVEIAKRDAFADVDAGYGYSPSPGPRITVRGGVKFDPEANGDGANNGVEGTFVPGRLSINFTAAQVKVNLQQYASLNIQYKDNNNE